MAQVGGEQRQADAPDALRVFISYSRQDATFTRRLADELIRLGYAPDFDQATYDPDNIAAGIAAEDEWWQRLQHMIAACDVMVFVVSPDSAVSKVCDEEIAWARGLGKRIIAILRRRIDFAKAPPRLSALNVKLDFTADDEADFKNSVDELARSLDSNVAWHRESTRLSTLLVRWLAADKNEALLLTATDLAALGKLLEGRPRDAPEPASALLEFRNQSRARLDTNRDRQRRIIGRTFVKPALAALSEDLFEETLRLAAAGALLAEDIKLELVPELWSPVAQAVMNNRTDNVLLGHGSVVTIAAFSPDGTRVVTGSSDNTARLWDAESGAEIDVLKAHSGTVWAASFSPDGTRVVTGSSDNTARLWDAESGAEITVLNHTDDVNVASFSPDGKRVLTCSDDKAVKIFDVLRSEAVVRGRALVLSASLSRSIGVRTDVEVADLLMQDAPEDLFAEALRQLGRPADDPELLQLISALHAPLHDNCYLSPTKFAEKFGLELPRRSRVADVEDTETDSGETNTVEYGEADSALNDAETGRAFGPMAIAEGDLAEETFVETRGGVCIFRLKDGRYHVVDHFAVATLDEAHAAADALAAACGSA